MSDSILFGKRSDTNANFYLESDLATHTFALIGIRGSGKTVAAMNMAYGLSHNKQHWITLDPIGVWWGLRHNLDGSKNELPLVVIGGTHGDFPLDKRAGALLAKLALEQETSVVIDLSLESKTTWRKVVADFCSALMEIQHNRRHLMIFLEEAPEFVPQKPMGEQKFSCAAVDRLIRLGRNRGYGVTLIGQRYATINKDVLSQCDTLITGRLIAHPDLKACKDWVLSMAPPSDLNENRRSIATIPHLGDGEFIFWSPQWMKVHAQIKTYPLKTFHPGATRAADYEKLVVTNYDTDVVVKFRDAYSKVMDKIERDVHRNGQDNKTERMVKFVPVGNDVPPRRAERASEADVLRSEIAGLREHIAKSEQEAIEYKSKAAAAEQKLAAVRELLEKPYAIMQELFDELGGPLTPVSCAPSAVLEGWKQRLGKGPTRLIDALQERGSLTRTQLATYAGYSKGGYFNNCLSDLRRNSLIAEDGDKVKLIIT